MNVWGLANAATGLLISGAFFLAVGVSYLASAIVGLRRQRSSPGPGAQRTAITRFFPRPPDRCRVLPERSQSRVARSAIASRFRVVKGWARRCGGERAAGCHPAWWGGWVGHLCWSCRFRAC